MSYPMFNEMALAFVKGIESAKTYQIPYGGSVLLMDTEKPMFYVKSTNPTGQVILKAYEFKEVQLKEQSSNQYVTKEQFNDLNSKIDAILSNMRGVKDESDISTSK